MTDESRYLTDLARRCAAPFAALPECRAVLLAGSAAEGIADRFSDIDLIFYWESFPERNVREAARGGTPALWQIGDPDAGAFLEALGVDGVEVQMAHTTVVGWEEDMASVLERLDVDSPLQKALDGLHKGTPLHGAAQIAAWRERAAYPDALARAMIERHLDFFPLWAFPHRLAGDEGALWRHQILVESAQRLLAVLSGLNRRYFATFQFKRLQSFCAGLTLAPERFDSRLLALFVAPPDQATALLRDLVAETTALVERHRPEIDTSAARARLERRAASWEMPSPR